MIVSSFSSTPIGGIKKLLPTFLKTSTIVAISLRFASANSQSSFTWLGRRVPLPPSNFSVNAQNIFS